MNFDLDMGLNLVVAFLLMIAIVYAALLNYRLKKLRSNKDDVDMAIMRFDQAVIKAEESISFLREISGKSYNALLESIQKSQALRDELFFLLEKGEELANKMDNQIRLARKETSPPSKNAKEEIEASPQEDNALLKLLKTQQEKEDAQIHIVSGGKKLSNVPSKAEESLLDILKAAR